MAFRMVHQILSECDIFISSDSKNHVRVRVTESNPERIDPSDFEIEGDRESILNFLANAADVIENLDLLAKEPGVLSFEEFLNFTKITHCHYCEGDIVWREFSRQIELKDGRGYGYNLDRKDNAKGYEKENVVVCCKFCNQLKRDLLTYEDMLLLRDSGLIKTLKERYESRGGN